MSHSGTASSESQDASCGNSRSGNANVDGARMSIFLSHPHGLFVLDKPPGPSSFDCIRMIKRYCGLPKKWKIGHLGTLDPFASGVLLIALGRAVKYSEFALKLRKKYRARVYLGEETDTLDPTGKVISTRDVPNDWKDRISDVLKNFSGEIEQIPPAYSAKQVDGKRAYKSARKGESVDLKPVKVTIYDLQVGEIGDLWFDFTCDVSSGTYVRTLGKDIAAKMGTVGHLVGLERMAVGEFSHEISVPMKAVEVGGNEALAHHLRGVEMLLSDLFSITIRDSSIEKIRHGRRIDETDLLGVYKLDIFSQSRRIRLFDESGAFLSLGRVDEEGSIIPYKPWIDPE